MQNFRKLLVWQKAHDLALGVHRETQGWPRAGNHGLIGQMRRASQSIPANIAEGCGRSGDKDFVKFLQIAIGSSVELEYHLQFAGDAEIMEAAASRMQQDRVVEVRRMLVGLMKKVRTSPSAPPPSQS